jgi:hypothetical protein
MWKPTSLLISALLVLDSFFVSYALGLNSRHVLVIDPALVHATAPVATQPIPAPQVVASAALPTAQDFTDLNATNGRLQSSLTQAADAGILDPVKDKKFHPNDPVTRADFTRWMVRVRQVPTDSPGASTYSDVKSSSPYFGDIEGATKAMMVQGYIVKGQPQKAFKPAQFITRQEFSVMYGTFSGKRGRAETLSKADVDRYLRYNTASSDFGKLTYRDVGDIDDWARKWAAVAQQAGVLGQCFDVDPYSADAEKTYLRPQEKMTRAEAVNILVKLYGIQSRTAVEEKN